MDQLLRTKQLSPNSAELPAESLKSGHLWRAEIGHFTENEEYFIVNKTAFGSDEFEAANIALESFNQKK